VPLAPKAFDTLVLLVERRGQLLEKDELMKALWPDSFVEEANLTVNISALRKALGERLHEHRYIITVPGRGYRFVASVAELPEEGAQALVEHTRTQIIIEEEEEKTKLRQPAAMPLLQQRPGRPSRTLILALGCALITLAAIAWTLSRFRTRPLDSQSQPIRSIAVLPLKNLTDDPSQDYFSDGMTESLITALSQVNELKVISRGSVIRFKGKETDPQEVGKQLEVAAVLEGSVRKSADSVRVAVRLVSVADGRVLWASDTHERQLGDVFALQDEIARSVVSGLRVKLSDKGAQQLARRYTDNVEAYQLYLKGQYVWHKITFEDLQKSIDYYHQALDKDPNYALAYAGIADSYVVLGNVFLPPNEAFTKAMTNAKTALELDETLAQAHQAMAASRMFYLWDWTGAESDLKRAIELNPSHAGAHDLYSYYLIAMGRLDEAKAETKRAQELDPLSLLIGTHVGVALYFNREYDRAIDQLRQTIDLDPHFPIAHSWLIQAYLQKGMYAEAIREAQAEREDFANSQQHQAIAALGYAYAVAGQRREAQRALAELSEASKQRYVSPLLIALIHAGLGDRDQAFVWLEKAYEDHSFLLIFLKVEPRFDTLRSDPRFTELERRVGLTPSAGERHS